jgi:hypothetical protein
MFVAVFSKELLTFKGLLLPLTICIKKFFIVGWPLALAVTFGLLFLLTLPARPMNFRAL